MSGWFESLPLHRKLIALVFGVSTISLAAAVVGFVAFDLVRFRVSAIDDAQALAQVLAENSAAAIVFGDSDAARQTLASVRVRPVIVKACVYRADGSLLTSYEAGPDTTCPTHPTERRSWRVIGSVVPVTRNGQSIGTIYVERALSDLNARLVAAAAAGGVMLLVAGGIALALAQSLQRTISRPIIDLAAAARGIGRQPPYEIPIIVAPPDETGELVRAFGDMVRRVEEANTELRAEVEHRREMQAEREGLLRREREASRLKDEFLAAVSHELRTPLNAILGWTQILTSTTPTEQMLAKAIASLSRNAQAQYRVIEDLLDISRIITGKLQLALTAVDLRSVVESALEVIAPIGVAKKIHIETLVPNAPCMVQADYDRLRQVVWNLLSNAVKFTPAGGSISVRVSEGSGSYAIAVSDTGVGIPAAFLPHVFERFRQADGSMTREYGGLGLGLAIVKDLTELHGGSVRAASDGPGRGATLTITLPEMSGRTARQLGPEASMSVPRLDGLNVLAVDDNPDALDIVTSALTEAGAIVRTASSGPDALTQWRRAPCHILLCDLAMPQMDGFEILRCIRQLETAAGRVTPVLAVTAYVSDEYRARCLRAGFQGHIAKPYNTVDLIRAVAAAVERAS